MISKLFVSKLSSAFEHEYFNVVRISANNDIFDSELMLDFCKLCANIGHYSKDAFSLHMDFHIPRLNEGFEENIKVEVVHSRHEKIGSVEYYNYNNGVVGYVVHNHKDQDLMKACALHIVENNPKYLDVQSFNYSKDFHMQQFIALEKAKMVSLTEADINVLKNNFLQEYLDKNVLLFQKCFRYPNLTWQSLLGDKAIIKYGRFTAY